MASLPIQFQTMYAELIERAAIAQLEQDFPVAGSFFTMEKDGRLYWYFREPALPAGVAHATQTTATPRRPTRYVGPDSEDLRRRIEAHKQRKESAQERRDMVRALVRGAGLPEPDRMTGRILEALAEAGVFRLRAVLIGTVAFQTYAGLLGAKLPTSTAMTSDLDIAQQFNSISVAVEDGLEMPLGDVLKRIDPRFRPRPTLDGGPGTSFLLGDGYRVDILSPNRGPEDDAPIHLPALGTDGQPLRFLDYLIYQEIQAVVLHGNGILVNVPKPERYALHKLLVSRLRAETRTSQAKIRKDLQQASLLLEILAAEHPFELAEGWTDLRARGPRWRELADQAASLLPPAVLNAGPPDRRLRDLFGVSNSAG